MRVLVVGGAGYVGSVTVAHLLARGHEVVVLDDLSTGHAAAVPSGARFVHGRVQDTATDALDGCDAVLHFASLSLVGESFAHPRRYIGDNVAGAVALLAAMEARGVRRLVFSSSAAVYGAPDVPLIDEDQPLAPVNPYGHSKAMVETLLREEARARGLSVLALRYFNAAGADGPHGEDHRPETHLVPRLCAHLLGRLPDFAVHGSDFPTADGTAIRDYVHVADLARAHALALEALEPGMEVLNLGTGIGASVREVLTTAARIAGREVAVPTGPRRAGDPPRLVASYRRAQTRLGWAPTRDLAQILCDALAWHEAHPEGYPPTTRRR